MLRRLLSTVFVIVVAVGAVACNDDDGSGGDTTVPDGVAVVDLEVGQCFLNPESTDQTEVSETACDEPHDAEVFATFDLDFDRDADFPGAAQVQTAGQEGCQARFADYVGQPYEESPYFLSALVPTQRTWNGRNDREVVCALTSPTDEPLDQSVRNTGGQ